jgi:hypothetical protein
LDEFSASFLEYDRNGGLLPDNTGGHHSVDNSPDALQVSSITTRLGITHANVPLAYVEMLQFFRRFGH